MGIKRHAWWAWLAVGFCAGSEGMAQPSAANPAADRVPVIYCTDLFHPHDDPDDHFDLATILAMPDLELKGIVLDQGGKQLQKPGKIPVSQMNHLAGRQVPAAIGLAHKLKSPTDPAFDQKAEFQHGVQLILDTLRRSPKPVMIAAVGSMRDVVAAFNREPDLFRAKAGKLLVFIGEASEPKHQEYNVALDPHAYVGLMRSGLPIYWVPCYDGGVWQNRGHASFWKAKHADVLKQARPELVQYFIYALEHERSDPIQFLHGAVDPQRGERLLAGTRNLWCTAIFGVLAGRTVAFDGTNYVFTDLAEPGTLFGFSEVELSISDDAVVHYGPGKDAKKVLRFEVRNPARYAEGMTAATARLLSGLRLTQ